VPPATSSSYSAARRGPTTMVRLAHPIRARGQTGNRDLVPFRWAPVGVNPTFSPLTSTYTLILVLNLILKLSTHFIIDQYIERLRHNSQLRTTRLNNYYASFHTEIDSYLILGPLVFKNHTLSLKPMPATCSLNTLGGKPFVNGSASICLVLMCSRLMV
jgi:hypothetical protein